MSRIAAARASQVAPAGSRASGMRYWLHRWQGPPRADAPGMRALAHPEAPRGTGRSARCNGLQSKLVGTAINGNLGPDYMHLSIPSRPHYLPLGLQSVARDCNQGDQDHINCNYPGSPSSPCLYAREGAYVSGERLGGATVSCTFRPGSVCVSPRVNPPC